MIILLGGAAIYSGFAPGTGSIWLNNVQCIGNETRLADCAYSLVENRNCIHSQDAGVQCVPCTEGSIQLSGGNSTCGRVEVCINHNWNVVCDHMWDETNMEVACRQLGFSAAGILT